MSKSKKKPKKSKQKRKMTCEQRERKRKFMIVFMNGKQKRVPRPPLIEGMPVDEFIARNADPIWLQQNELWEYMPTFDDPCGLTGPLDDHGAFVVPDDDSFIPPDPIDEFREFIVPDDELSGEAEWSNQNQDV